MTKEDDFSFLKCLRCGLQFVYPLPDKETLKNYYNNYPDSRRVKKSINEYLDIANLSFIHQISVVSEIGGYLGDKKRFLDVGFGAGHYLSAARENGFATYGVELDRTSFEEVEKTAKNVYNCELDEAPFDSDFFDIVKMAEILEHSPEPLNLLKSALRVIKKGGFLVVDVPNQSSFIAKIKIFLRHLGLRKDYGFISPPNHLFGFTKKTLCLALSKAGFENKKIVFTSQADWRYHPSTPSRTDSLRNIFIKCLYFLFGKGSTICVYARKP
jgi:SAM-dependent methyltransferase